MAKRWYGSSNVSCDICGDSDLDMFVDGKVAKQTAWALMCLGCHEERGVGLGTGVGQLYKRDETGYVKVGG